MSTFYHEFSSNIEIYGYLFNTLSNNVIYLYAATSLIVYFQNLVIFIWKSCLT